MNQYKYNEEIVELNHPLFDVVMLESPYTNEMMTALKLKKANYLVETGVITVVETSDPEPQIKKSK